MAFKGKNLIFPDKKEAQNSDNFKENVKNSFKRARGHINLLENELKANKEIIIKQNEHIKFLLEQMKDIHEFFKDLKAKNAEEEKSSTGNNGVSLFGYSPLSSAFDNQKSINKSNFPIKEPKFTLAKSFKSVAELCQELSRQELMTFLLLYDLEEELKNVTYQDIAKRMNISEGCVRTYVSGLIKKGLPVLKKKFNNRIVFLSIFPDFRSLNPRKELEAYYYQYDPTQKRLVDKY